MALSYQMFVNDYSGAGAIINPAGLTLTNGANQHARVDLLTASAAPDSTASADVVHNFYLGTDAGANPHAYQSYTFDITPYVTPGQTYQLRFADVDTLFFMNMGVDNVSVTTAVLPAAPSGLTLATATDSGVQGDNITNIPTPIIQGSAEPGTTVKVTDNNNLVGQTITAADGSWSLTTSALSPGTHTLIATATNSGGKSPVSLPLTILIDTTAPQVSITSTPASLTNNASADFSISTSDSSVNGSASGVNHLVCWWDGNAPLSLPGSSSFGVSLAVPDGPHTFSVYAVDNAGNPGATSTYSWTVDTTAPTTSVSLLGSTGLNGWFRSPVTVSLSAADNLSGVAATY